MKNTQIIILAAGHGKRMQSELPKALTPLLGKPFIRHVLSTVKKSGICDKPIIVIGQKGDQVRGVLGDGHLYAIQDKQLGTGHAVMMAEKLSHGKENVLILYADHPMVSAQTIKNLAKTHCQDEAIITMATAAVKDFKGWRKDFLTFGRFVRDANGQIEKIIEIKDASEKEKKIKEVNPAYMCFKASWMWGHLKKLQNKNAQGEYYLTDLIKMAFDEKEKISSIKIEDKEALGVNSQEELKRLEKIIR